MQEAKKSEDGAKDSDSEEVRRRILKTGVHVSYLPSLKTSRSCQLVLRSFRVPSLFCFRSTLRSPRILTQKLSRQSRCNAAGAAESSILPLSLAMLWE